jgi:hypothetical protein
MTENSAAWQKVFAQLELPVALRERGLCFLTADQLKRHGGREPRLMAKIDTLQERPEIFAEHQVNLFPVKNGEYVLFKDPENKTYFKLNGALERLAIQSYLAPGLPRFHTLPDDRSFSESQAIDFAFVASLLRTFFGDPGAHLTIRGRLFSDRFSFQPPGGLEPVPVHKVQIEVDAGYEGAQSIFLIEAKIGKRDDFNIRQLWYPFLNWSAKSAKRIVPILLNFSNGQYYLTEFGFSEQFGELAVVRSEAYTINDSPIALLDWPRLWAEIAPETETTPFPQADDLDKVIDLVKLAGAGPTDKAQIGEFFEFDQRQGDYYANAAKYLGLLERTGAGFQVTSQGVAFNRLPTRADRTVAITRVLLKRPAFRRAIGLLRDRNFLLASLGVGELAGIIAEEAGLNASTAGRRALTVRCWLTWLLKNSQPVGWVKS